MKKAVFLFALIVGGFLIGIKAKAATTDIYSENFDSYSNGVLISTVDNWTILSGTSTISNATSFSSPNSLTFDNPDSYYSGSQVKYTFSSTNTTNSGLFHIKVNMANLQNGQTWSIYIRNGGGTPGDIYGNRGTTNCAIGINQGTPQELETFTTDCNNWFDIAVYWNESGSSSIAINSGTPHWFSFTNNTYSYLEFDSQGTNDFFVDDIDFVAINTNIATNSYNGAYIYPIWPEDCYYNTNAWTGNAIGTIGNPASSTVHFYKFEMLANDYFTGDKVSASTSVDIDPGETKNYSFPYSLASTTLWEIGYILYGQDINTGVYSYIAHDGESACVGDITTWIGEPASSTLELLACDIEILGTDCAASSSQFTWTESLLCELSETMRGTFIPSCSGRAKLDRYLSTLKHRAPYNYVKLTQNFFSNFFIPTSTDSTSSIGGGMIELADSFRDNQYVLAIRSALKGLLYLLFGWILYTKIIRKMFK